MICSRTLHQSSNLLLCWSYIVTVKQQLFIKRIYDRHVCQREVKMCTREMTNQSLAGMFLSRFYKRNCLWFESEHTCLISTLSKGAFM